MTCPARMSVRFGWGCECAAISERKSGSKQRRLRVVACMVASRRKMCGASLAEVHFSGLPNADGIVSHPSPAAQDEYPRHYRPLELQVPPLRFGRDDNGL